MLASSLEGTPKTTGRILKIPPLWIDISSHARPLKGIAASASEARLQRRIFRGPLRPGVAGFSRGRTSTSFRASKNAFTFIDLCYRDELRSRLRIVAETADAAAFRTAFGSSSKRPSRAGPRVDPAGSPTEGHRGGTSHAPRCLPWLRTRIRASRRVSSSRTPQASPALQKDL
jgi:hypothetical protein